MRAHVIDAGVVVNTIEVESLDFMPNLVSGENGGGIGDTYQDGQFVKPAQPQKTAEQVFADVVASVQQRLDDFAATKNYAGILSACTYATDPNPVFAAEGQYCVAQRSATWSKCYEILAQVEAGTRPIPEGYSDIEPELPALQWPI